MLPPCLSLEESFRKSKKKKKREKTRVFYAELGLSCEVRVQTQTSPNLRGDRSALCWGAWCLGSWGAPREGGRSRGVCEMEV